jgi:hypothetical protein
MKPMRITVVTSDNVVTLEVDRYVHEYEVSYLENARPADVLETVAGQTFDWLVLIDGSEIGRFMPATTSVEDGPLGPRLVIRGK